MAGCSVVKTANVPTVPAALLLPTKGPEWTGETVGDLVEYAQDLESALEQANADKTAVSAIVSEANTMGKER